MIPASARAGGADYDFTAHLTRFCRALRASGLLVGPPEVADTLRAMTAVDVMDRGRVYWALRTLLLSRRDELPIYDALFERFWNFEPMPARAARPDADDGDPAGGAKDFRRAPRIGALPREDAGAENTLVQMLRSGAAARRARSSRDLAALRADELAQLQTIAARMLRAMAARPGRRRKRHRRKGVPDLRAAFRVNIGAGGEILSLPRKRRAPRAPRLLVMLDVSGSMDRHVELLLQLVFAVAQHTNRVEAFAFSTEMRRVTRELNAPTFGDAMARVGGAVADWSGGTRIGEALAHVNAQRDAMLSRHTTAFLLSDGWDAGDPERLGLEIRRMRRRIHRFVWLNPLLGGADYEPRTRSLAAALPHVDCHASARDIEALKRLPSLLR